ncbi:hypothetical protein INR49_031080 [Caranx melampygus]|nr:hypothetical protein INR49_031080 [Caranx melampygus]
MERETRRCDWLLVGDVIRDEPELGAEKKLETEEDQRLLLLLSDFTEDQIMGESTPHQLKGLFPVSSSSSSNDLKYCLICHEL